MRRRMLLVLTVLMVAFGCVGCSHFSADGEVGGGKTLEEALTMAEHAYASGLATTSDQQAYAAATEQVVACWLALSDEKTRARSLEAGRAYRVEVSWPKKLLFDELIPASTIKGGKLKRHIIREGVGVPFLAHWRPTAERMAAEPFLRAGGYNALVTATLEFRRSGQGIRVAELAFHDPCVSETVHFAGKVRPLAADFSAIGEYLLSRKELQMSGLGALMHPAKSLDRLGLLALERPAPDRIPAIFVHGLMSRPVTWQNLLNELSDDPEVRSKYQIYLFRYPSGVPVIYSAAELRSQLALLHCELAKRGGHVLGHQMVLVGHSMGGLVSKSQVQDSGDRLWVNIFGSTPDNLGLSREEHEALDRFLNFEPNPHVSRVVFIATPHRGSELASGTLGKLGRKLINLPENAVSSALGILQVGGQNPVMDKIITQGVPTSVDNLSHESPYVRNTMSLPLRPGLRIHSIIGSKDGLPPGDPRCTDGFVPYTSSHLDGAESELIIRVGHGVHDTPEAAAEIARILRLHLRSL
ncbi:MAG: hypothetical protein R3F13_13545 [Prosthecobacter sp.]